MCDFKQEANGNMSDIIKKLKNISRTSEHFASVNC